MPVHPQPVWEDEHLGAPRIQELARFAVDAEHRRGLDGILGFLHRLIRSVEKENTFLGVHSYSRNLSQEVRFGEVRPTMNDMKGGERAGSTRLGLSAGPHPTHCRLPGWGDHRPQA